MNSNLSTEELFLATNIYDRFVDASILLSSEEKLWFKAISAYTREFLNAKPSANAYERKTLTHELLRYWNDRIHPESEAFWMEMQIHNISFIRKDPLEFALKKQRFRNVEQAIDARKFWYQLALLPSIILRFTAHDKDLLQQVISSDQEYRLNVLNKVLLKQTIPRYLYLKFGESMAYFKRCELLSKYFTPDEESQLYSIWSAFAEEPK